MLHLNPVHYQLFVADMKPVQQFIHGITAQRTYDCFYCLHGATKEAQLPVYYCRAVDRFSYKNY